MSIVLVTTRPDEKKARKGQIREARQGLTGVAHHQRARNFSLVDSVPLQTQRCLSFLTLEFVNRPAPDVPRVESAVIADVHEHQAVNQGQQLVQVIEVDLHELFLRLPAAVRRWMPQLIPSLDFLTGDRANVLE